MTWAARFGLGDATRKAGHVRPIAAAFDFVNVGNELKAETFPFSSFAHKCLDVSPNSPKYNYNVS
jgi:hypothetical protein